MRVGDPAYVALTDRMAAHLRDQLDACSDQPSLRRAVIEDCRRNEYLLTALLDQSDPLVAVALYRDHVRQVLSTLGES